MPVRHPSPSTRCGRLRIGLVPLGSSLQKPSSRGLPATPAAALPEPFRMATGSASVQRELAVQESVPRS